MRFREFFFLDNFIFTHIQKDVLSKKEKDAVNHYLKCAHLNLKELSMINVTRTKLIKQEELKAKRKYDVQSLTFLYIVSKRDCIIV